VQTLRDTFSSRPKLENRGIFRPYPREIGGTCFRSHLPFRAVEVSTLNTNGTATVFYLPAMPVGTEAAIQWCGLRVAGAARAYWDTGPAGERAGRREDEAADEDNVVEFRSLTRHAPGAGLRPHAIRLSREAADLARATLGRKLRLESNLEEEPE
jgi:hypothetical protein